VSYLDPVSGLKVDCHIKGYKDFNTVEWVLIFTNTSGKKTYTIEQMKVIDYNALSKNGGASVIYHALGSDAKRSDFQPIKTSLGKGKSIHMEPTGGRSSDDSGFTFFNIETPDHTGIVTAIGWTGSWFADIDQTDINSVSLKAGMAHMKLFLYPEETIRTPCICLLFWESSDFMTGQNQFRRFLLAHYSRQIKGKMTEYPISGGFNWGDPSPYNEYSCLTEDYACALINRYKQFGIMPEVFWLDAGWYKYTSDNWATNTGNWEVDTIRFPNGLEIPF